MSTIVKSKLFKQALNFVLSQEGGYVNDPDDNGGATNLGITQGVYNAYRDDHNLKRNSVRNISRAEAEDIYYTRYWQPAGCEKYSPVFAILAFDTAVNMGVSRVSQFLKAADYISPEKFMLARIEKYAEIAKPATQRKFLLPWLNRSFRLISFIKNV